ncbi:MAG: 16S rRNA (cytosine(1402)-N(4))-methyltransferase RsmH [Syntrophaceae bacterium]|nr:16S rRNA (cytosine(1402)-N(4))-methyltransferase RsmH [Syntrophaceae bacterium]
MNDGRRTGHVPVLVEEVMGLLGCQPGRIYVDATLGGGGHALEILKRTAPDGVVIGIDWDEEAISEAKQVLRPYGERVRIFRENFIHLADLLNQIKVDQVDGILLDLGLSSLQLEKEERGFSFRGEGPLDMRMDQRIEHTAADWIDHLSREELEDVLSGYGQERWAKRIATAIVRVREQSPIQTTQALRKLVHRAVGGRCRSWRIDPATRVFQAFRIKVNDELENLRKILETGWRLLRKGGRICVISFHSLEDRIVKESFRRLEKGEMDASIPGRVIRILTPKPVRPSADERRRNPRSRSARLRCAERI